MARPAPAPGIRFVVQLLHAGEWSTVFVVDRVSTLGATVYFHAPSYLADPLFRERPEGRRMKLSEWRRLRAASQLISYWPDEDIFLRPTADKRATRRGIGRPGRSRPALPAAGRDEGGR